MKNHEWISVHDRLPSDDRPVLVYTPSTRTVWIDCWAMQHESLVSWSSATIETGYAWAEWGFDEVSHWMPLPEPPSKP